MMIQIVIVVIDEQIDGIYYKSTKNGQTWHKSPHSNSIFDYDPPTTKSRYIWAGYDIYLDMSDGSFKLMKLWLLNGLALSFPNATEDKYENEDNYYYNYDYIYEG